MTTVSVFGGTGFLGRRLVLVSGIGADPQSGSPHIRARGRGERAVRQAFPGATIVRPGAMFGPGDALFSTLADIARLLADRGTVGQTDELAGPGVYTLRELVSFALRLIDKRRLLVPLPFAVAGERRPAGFPRPRYPAAGARGHRANLYRPAAHARAGLGSAGVKRAGETLPVDLYQGLRCARLHIGRAG